MIDIKELGKGILPDPPDPRDYRLEEIIAAPTVDWSKEVMLPDVTDFDQMSSDSCGPVGSSFYHEQLVGKVFSKRDLSCRTLLAYGSYTRDNMLQIVEYGQADNKEVVDPISPNYDNMRDTKGTAAHLRIDDREFEARSFPAYNIDYVAYCIDNFRGCVFGVWGDNIGWVDHANPKPPKVHEWGHLIYAQGHHMHDGQKCIIAKSSWYPKSSSVKYHHIKEDYFRSDTMSPWVIIPKKRETMKLVLDNGTAFIVGRNGKKVGLADQGLYQVLKEIDGEEIGSTAGIPQVKVIETRLIAPFSGFVIKDN